MASLKQRTERPVVDRSTPDSAPTDARDRRIRGAALLVSVGVLGWSLVELISLGLKHTTGPELYGVLVAVLATGAAGANLALLRSPRAQVLVVLAALVVWAVVAVAGVAGTVAHIVGAPIGEGPVDPRPRPMAAPLVFTLLGLIGGAALLVGQRAAFRRARIPWKE
jgi:hypothetical protein